MQTIRKGTTLRGTVVLLQQLLQHAGFAVAVDGDFGPGTDRAVRQFQSEHGLVVDGVIGDKSWMTFAHLFPEFFGDLRARFLTEADLRRAAETLGVELAAIKAVRDVEAGTTGFWGDKPKILFERHIFFRQLTAAGKNARAIAQANPDICSQKTGGYIGGIGEYTRLDRARALDDFPALESASWGLFQIMGFHWKNLDYESPKAFVDQMFESEGKQLDAFVRFIQKENLGRFMKTKDWAGFARRYNGPAFAKNAYDTKLARAYARHHAAEPVAVPA